MENTPVEAKSNQRSLLTFIALTRYPVGWNEWSLNIISHHHVFLNQIFYHVYSCLENLRCMTSCIRYIVWDWKNGEGLQWLKMRFIYQKWEKKSRNFNLFCKISFFAISLKVDSWVYSINVYLLFDSLPSWKFWKIAILSQFLLWTVLWWLY